MCINELDLTLRFSEMRYLNRKPNFFIVGAPKAGTTALSFYLKEHPNVFMCSPKEPHYYATDFHHGKGYITNEDEYFNLFRNAVSQHIAIGEASVHYLFSSVALHNIRAAYNNAKIIIMIRNPLEMIPSLHNQLLYSFIENEKDIEIAWSLQELRKEGKFIPRYCPFPEILQYGEQCKLGYQVERALSIFPTSNVKIFLFDYFRLNPGHVYLETLDFLCLEDDGRSDFAVINPRKRHKFSNLGRFFLRPPKILLFLKKILKLQGTGIWDRISSLNNENIDIQPLQTAFKSELIDYFKDDVKKLSSLTGYCLDIWLK